MPRIVFTPVGLSAEVANGTTVLQAARSLGVDLDSVCGGRGICGRCQITAQPGSHPKWAIESDPAALSPSGDTEAAYRDRRGMAADRRLGCCATVLGDVVVDVPAESQVHRPVVRKSLHLDDVVVDPAVHLFFLQLEPVELGDAASMTDLVTAALREDHGCAVDSFTRSTVAELHRAFARAALGGTVAVRRGVVVGAWAGFRERVVGVAIDIGSTTIAGHLCDLHTGEVLATTGRMNPQIRFGDDLMSRVSYVMMNEDGQRTLTDAVRTALDELIGELCDEAGVERSLVLEVVLVGNPVMHHLVAGFDPTPLGQAPFTLATADALTVPSGELDLALPHAEVYLAPCIAGHVGADTAAVILAEGPHRSANTQLIVDVGTNAEIVLGDHSRVFAASSPTGPAFEGAQLSAGQRATAGAVERVRIDRETLEPRVKVIGCELWSDDDGFTAATSALGISGICGSGIIEVVAEMYLSGIIDADGVIDGALADRTDRVVPDGRTYSYLVYRHDGVRLAITQNDVRAIQLAKAALRAGIELLMHHASIDELEDVRLAGAFGSHIDPFHASVLGLVPDCPLERVRSVGNAAGEGAVRALLSQSLRREMETVARSVHKIETATEPGFQAEFVAAMAFPHATRATPHLASVTPLPARRQGEPRRRARRRDDG